MVFLLNFVLNLLITSALLYKIVAMLNPNPEHNPSFQDAIVYSFIGALIGNLPNIFFLPIISVGSATGRGFSTTSFR